MERLSGLDGVFLAIEDGGDPMNIGSLAIFEGPAPSLDEVIGFLSDRLAAVPRCRQRVRTPAGPIGRRMWVDDNRFDLSRHVHHLPLPDPESRRLDDLVAELVAAPMDRRRPLWHVWVIDGLADGTWALLAKVHHCMVDGIAGNDLLSAILEPTETPGTPEAPPASPASPASPAPPAPKAPESLESLESLEAWRAAPEPTPFDVARFGIRSALTSAVARFRSFADALGHPRRSWTRTRNVVVAARRLWYRQPHRPTSLVGPIGTTRRWARRSVPLGDIGSVRESLGGTVNDVVLAAISIGFREFLVGRGEPVEGRNLTVMVPVSLRRPAERGEVGNRVANVHALLPVDDGDPRSTLRRVHEHLDELKESHEVEATGLVMGIGEFVPRVLADRVARAVVGRQRNVETVVTNVPGPRRPLLLDGRRMLGGYPVAPIAGRVRVTVAIWSYAGELFVGITADRDSVPDVELLADGIVHGFGALADVARG